MPRNPTIAEIVLALDRRFPAGLAADWDAVGLVCGDPTTSIRSVLFAVDPVIPVVAEAISIEADLIVTHHPLFLQGVHSVAPTTHGGRVVHELVSAGIGLFTAHTNADCAAAGVSDALAAALGLTRTRPLDPSVIDSALGIGRIGVLERPLTLEQFSSRVAQVLPRTHHGVRVSGDSSTMISMVAVCGGAGDEYLPLAAGAADAYVTSDLRHHRALDHRLAGGCALIDVAHWAGEWPWLAGAAGQLQDDLAVLGATVEVHVSVTPTDPWTAHVASSS